MKFIAVLGINSSEELIDIQCSKKSLFLRDYLFTDIQFHLSDLYFSSDQVFF